MAALTAILLLAGSYLGTVHGPGTLGVVGHAVCASSAGAGGVALYLAAWRERGYQSTQTTSLAAGLFVLIGLMDASMIMSSAVGVQAAATVVNLALALVTGAIGIFGVERPAPRATRGDGS